MTTNEKIAWWAYKVYEGSGFTATEPVYIVKGGDKLLFMDHRGYEPPCLFRPDQDDWPWRGDDGLLAEIERQGERHDFMHHLWAALPVERRTEAFRNGMWVGLTATPAQLAAALVAVIKEE